MRERKKRRKRVIHFVSPRIGAEKRTGGGERAISCASAAAIYQLLKRERERRRRDRQSACYSLLPLFPPKKAAADGAEPASLLRR